MAYSKTTWADGDTITATKLNNAENGISANDSAITTANGKIVTSASISSGVISFKNSGGTTQFTVTLPIYSGGVS